MYFKVEFKLLLKCKANYYWKRKANANWVRSYIPCAFLPNSVQQKNNTILTRARHPCGRPNSPSDPSDFTAAVLGWGFWSRVPLGPCYYQTCSSVAGLMLPLGPSKPTGSGEFTMVTAPLCAGDWNVVSVLEVKKPSGMCPAHLKCCPCISAGGHHVCSLNILFWCCATECISDFFRFKGSMRPLLVPLLEAEFPDSMPICPDSVLHLNLHRPLHFMYDQHLLVLALSWHPEELWGMVPFGLSSPCFCPKTLLLKQVSYL